MPEFHAREPEHQEWTRRVLAGEIDLPEVDLAALPPAARTRQAPPPPAR
jgi:hypothetical protein